MYTSRKYTTFDTFNAMDKTFNIRTRNRKLDMKATYLTYNKKLFVFKF